MLTATLLACNGKDTPNYPPDPINPPTPGKTKSGQLELVLKVEVNVTTKAPNTDSYIVKICNAGTETVAKDINGTSAIYTCATVPAIVTLPVGDYQVCAFSHELTAVEWDKPYYHGVSDVITIQESKMTQGGSVTCKLQNVKVTVDYGPNLLEELADFVVVVNNGTGFKEFTRSETRAAYFSEAPLTVTLNGTRHDGEKVSKQVKYTDVEAGQHRKITMEVEFYDGYTQPDLQVDVTTKVYNLNENVEVEEPEIEDPEQPDPDTEVSIKGDGFDIKQPVSYPQYEQRTVIVNIFAEVKIQDLWVEIISDFLTEEELESLKIPKRFNLADLTPELKETFGPNGLGLIGNDPIRGAESMKFDITTFTSMLPEGSHKFVLTLKDKENNTVSENLILNPYL